MVGVFEGDFARNLFTFWSCSNVQSRSIGEDGDTGSDVTPRVPLYMDIISLFVRFVTSNVQTTTILWERTYK
jgi:hypothetical protein